MVSQLQKTTVEIVPEATHPWVRQIGETNLAYRLFSVFRDQGISRNIKEVAKDLGRKRQTIKNLSIDNQWEMRAGAYDEYQNRILEKKLQYEIVDARKRHHRLGAMMMDFAQESIENLRSMNDLLSVKDIVLLTEAGHKIESVALGMSTDITESRVAADVHVSQKETIPVAILERIGEEIATAKSMGEDTEEIETQFEELVVPQLLADGKKVPVPV